MTNDELDQRLAEKLPWYTRLGIWLVCRFTPMGHEAYGK